MSPPITRRSFLATGSKTLAATVLGGGMGFGVFEAFSVTVHRETIPVEGLPKHFDGLKIAFLTDLHRGYFISQDHVAQAVEMANSLQPDLVLLGGDYVHDDSSCIASVMSELGKLQAPLGVFAILGNRDIKANRILTSQQLARNEITELTNKGQWIQRENERFWLCGLDDCAMGHPDPAAALRGASESACVLTLVHNPRYVDFVQDPRIGLFLCGHTHGGQINLPLLGRPFLPEGCEKYPCGLFFSGKRRVFVSTGVGAIFPPIRIGCPAEIDLLTLRAS